MSSLLAVLMAVGCSSPAGPGPQNAQEDVSEPSPSAPGQVLDLVVTDSTGTSVTLSFTQVDDGNGHPADYSVRSHVGPMNWGTAEEVSHGTCAAPLQGTAIGSRLSCTVENLIPGTPYTFQIAAFRGAFQAGAVYGNLSNVVPDMTGKHPNEPAGLSTIASVDFTNGINAQTGACTERNSNEYIADASTPTGDGAVFRGKFPSGMGDGVSPWRFDCWGPTQDVGGGSNQYDEIYVSFWMKIDGTDFENQTVGTKILYVAYGRSTQHNDGYLMLHNGTGDQAVQSEMSLKFAPFESSTGTQVFHYSNKSSTKIGAGSWQHVELHLKVDDVEADDGLLRIWIDGELTHDYSDIDYRSADGSRAFYHLQFTPVWGGNGGDVRTREDAWRVADVYVSGR